MISGNGSVDLDLSGLNAAADEAFKELFPDLAGAPAQEEKVPDTTTAVEPIPEETAKTEADPTEEVDESKGQPVFVAKALKRVADREKRVADREKALEARERDSGKPAKEAPAQEWTKARIKANLSGYLKDHVGVDPAMVARALMAETLGDDAPPEYRNINSKLKEGGARDEEIEALRGEIHSLQERLEGRANQRDADDYVASYARNLDVCLAGDLKESPRVAQVLANDKEWTMSALWDVIRRDAADKQSRGAAQDPMTPREAVAALDKWLSRFVTVGQSGAPPPVRKTLTNAAPPVPPTPKDPTDFEVAERDAMDWLLKQTA